MYSNQDLRFCWMSFEDIIYHILIACFKFTNFWFSASNWSSKSLNDWLIINFKLEGKSTNCSTLKNKFQFHIGGYLPPFQSIREVSVYPKENDLMVNIDISRFFSEINLAEINSIMIPGKKAIEMSKLITPIFYSNWKKIYSI